MIQVREKLYVVFLLWMSMISSTSAFVFQSQANSAGRRKFIRELILLPTFAGANIVQAANFKDTIESRLDGDILTMPPPSKASEFNGVDNLYYPEWLEGTWSVTQTLVKVNTPLGTKFVGGPAGSEAIAAESLKEQAKQLNVPVKLQLRFVKTKFGVAEDRLFNTKERLNSFAGRNVVSSVEYANVGGSNRSAVLAMGGNEDDPLQTTVVRFKGPAAQKTFMLGHGESNKQDPGKFFGYETLRSIFALTNQNTAPPVTTDTECIWSFEKEDKEGRNIKARLRLASYLNPQTDFVLRCKESSCFPC
jgi:hypothetical protein